MAGYTRSALTLALVAAASQLFVMGCHPPPPVYIVQAAPQQRPVPARPPEVREEIRPSCPDEGWIWIAGYWHWDGDEYQWVEGAWVPPREGYSHYSANYLFINNQWMYQAAYWYPSHMPHPGGPNHGHGGHGSYQGHKGHKHQGHGGSGTHGGEGAPQGSDTPSKVRVSAPPADKEETPGKKRVKAPPAATGQDPDEVARKTKGQHKHLPAYDEDRRRPEIKPSKVNVKVLKGHLDYRGTRKGRMVFSNIPDGKGGHGYPTDRTGAIILVPDKGKENSAWKAAARVAPRGHRPDPVVVEVHTGDPRMKLRVRRSRAESEPEGSEPRAKKKQPPRRKVIVDTRQRTHYKPAAAGQRSGARRQTVILRPNTVPTPRRAYQPQPRRVYGNAPSQPRRARRPQPRPQPRRVRPPAPRPQLRRGLRPTPRPQPRPVQVAAPPKKRQPRAAPPAPAPKEKKRKRKRR